MPAAKARASASSRTARSNQSKPSAGPLAGAISADMISRYIRGRWVKVPAADAGEAAWAPIS